ncbi:MAG: glycosyltransferase family 2 protein [Erysipelotrichaceae bacterium]|nr:glycosyltransferase family 2 protein [Erysipelotrichaceae bacterium]
MKKLISIVAPAYNEEEVVETFCVKITEVMQELTNYDYEIVISNDGSKDRTFELSSKICSNDHHIKLVDLSRNYGHEIALAAGIDFAAGDAMILMDIDLQDPPELIPELIKKYEEGFEVVNARRISRDGETFMKKFTAKLFYKVIAKANKKINIPENVGNYRLISRRVADSYKKLQEKHRFTRGLISWTGYKTCAVDFHREARLAGQSKYHWDTMINFAIEGFTSFTTNPLRWASYFAFGLAGINFIYFIYIIIQFVVSASNFDFKYHFMFFSMIAISTLIAFFIGVLGEYVGRVFDETKQRPLYFVQSLVNIDEK